jgi:hypothetical protein
MKLFNSWKFVPLHLALVVLISFGLIYYFFNVHLPSETLHGSTVEVPNVENLDFDEAKTILEDLGLEPIIQEQTFSELHKLNAVVNQIPIAGDIVKPDRKIYLTINSKEIPLVGIDSNVVDYKFYSAGISQIQENLTRLNLKPGKRIDSCASFGTGYIFELRFNGQVLRHGDSIPRWSPVDYVVAVEGNCVNLNDTASVQDSNFIDLLNNAEIEDF